MACYEKAKLLMRASGNHKQWTNGYPSRDIVAADIAAGNCHVGVHADGSPRIAYQKYSQS
ncbi:MAG: hypothetical protein K2F91_09905 [Muribaculaceae bacterium]|nr:hypothetical protein [Muribaculaceae bacterium]